MNEEKFLRALGNLQNMAIDNTKNSKAVEICVNDIQNYVKQQKDIIKKAKTCVKKNIVDYITNYDDLREELLEILDKEW